MKAIASAVLSLSILTTGCANHLPQHVETTSTIERETISKTIDIEGKGGAFRNWEVAVTTNEQFKVEHFNNMDTYEVFTPYQGARELYEIPVGLVCIVGGVVVNVVDFALLGLLPNKLTDGPLDVGFAGLNPFMNIESDKRNERVLLKSEKTKLDSKTESLKMPFADGDIQLSYSDVSVNKVLNKNGKLAFDVFNLAEETGVTLSGDVTVTVTDEDATGVRTFRLPRQFSVQLQEAKNIISLYDSGAAAESIDIEKAAKDVFYLASIGFDEESHRIESSLMKLLDEEKKAELSKAVKGLFL